MSIAPTQTLPEWVTVTLLFVGAILLLMAWTAMVVFFFIRSRRVNRPPPDLPPEEACRRIAALLEQGKVVCLENIQPEFAVWYRSCFPWPLSWICRWWVEKELRQPFDGIHGQVVTKRKC